MVKLRSLSFQINRMSIAESSDSSSCLPVQIGWFTFFLHQEVLLSLSSTIGLVGISYIASLSFIDNLPPIAYDWMFESFNWAAPGLTSSILTSLHPEKIARFGHSSILIVYPPPKVEIVVVMMKFPNAICNSLNILIIINIIKNR